MAKKKQCYKLYLMSKHESKMQSLVNKSNIKVFPQTSDGTHFNIAVVYGNGESQVGKEVFVGAFKKVSGKRQQVGLDKMWFEIRRITNLLGQKIVENNYKPIKND